MKLESRISRKSLFKFVLSLYGTLTIPKCKNYNNYKFLVLNSYEIQILVELAREILPDTNLIFKVVQRIDEELTFVDTYISSDFQYALYAFDLYSLLFYWKRFSSLSSHEKRNYIDNIIIEGNNEIMKSVYNNLRMFIYLVYYDQPETWKKIQYDGPFSGVLEKSSEQRLYYQNLIF